MRTGITYMRKKFIFGVFEQYLIAYGDSHMGICAHFAQEICIQGTFACECAMTHIGRAAHQTGRSIRRRLNIFLGPSRPTSSRDSSLPSFTSLASTPGPNITIRASLKHSPLGVLRHVMEDARVVVWVGVGLRRGVTSVGQPTRLAGQSDGDRKFSWGRAVRHRPETRLCHHSPAWLQPQDQTSQLGRC
jgi:hypothetical protein